MTKASCARRLVAIAVLAFLGAVLMVPNASADIIGVQQAANTNCSSTGLTQGGGTICYDNTTAFSLTALEDGTESLQAVVGTQTSPVYLVDNNTGSTSFTLTFNGLLASNQFLTCQENGAFAGDSCSISGALGKVGAGAQYGPPNPSPTAVWNPDVSITFTGVGAGDFDIAFASFGNGASGTLTGVPESSSSLQLLAIGLLALGLVGLLQKGRRSEKRAY